MFCLVSDGSQMKHIKQVIFTYIVSSDEKTYCTSAAGVTFFPSCRRLFFRCLVRNFQILDAFNKWIPTFPASLTKISFKRHTKALSRTLTPFHKKETTPTDKHTHTQLSQTKKNKSVPTKTRAPTNKNLKVPNVFLKRSGRFFFFFPALKPFRSLILISFSSLLALMGMRPGGDIDSLDGGLLMEQVGSMTLVST